MFTVHGKPGRAADEASAPEIVEGGLFQSVGNLCFRSTYSDYLWKTSVSAPYRVIRVAAMTLISLLLLARSWRLFVRSSPDVAMVLAAMSIASWQFGTFRTIALLTLALLLTLAKQLASTPDVNSGHRAGGKGYEGEHIENTLEALRALIKTDNETPNGLKRLAYVEFDVHETGDGELMVLHDLHSVLAASQQFEINKDILAELARAGLQPEAPATSILAKLVQKAGAAGRGLYGDTAGLQSLTAPQLKRVHISGRQGVHVPTLEEFLRCCSEEGLQRSVAVEVKSIATDAGRARFVQLLTSYKQDFEQRQNPEVESQLYPPFASIAAISFPFFWAPSFGEFGSPAWRRWAVKFKQCHIPTRCCVWHALDLTRGG
ncbi:hypothetical protein ABBQ32_010705 [Trebouxia sp. C0010 RCD-2024]